MPTAGLPDRPNLAIANPNPEAQRSTAKHKLLLNVLIAFGTLNFPCRSFDPCFPRSLGTGGSLDCKLARVPQPEAPKRAELKGSGFRFRVMFRALRRQALEAGFCYGETSCILRSISKPHKLLRGGVETLNPSFPAS